MGIDYSSAGMAFAVSGYVIFLCGIWFSKWEVNAVTFMLYSIINGITVYNVWLLGGNTDVLYVYTVGSVAVFLSLVLKKQFKWTWVESFITLLVAICIIVWLLASDWATVIAGATSAGLANFPLLYDVCKKPDRDKIAVWSVFLLANICFGKAGKEWSVEEMLYPIVAGICCVLVIIASLRTRQTV